MTVIPRGMLHFSQNFGPSDVTYFSAFKQPEPGSHRERPCHFASRLFGSPDRSRLLPLIAYPKLALLG